MINIPATEYDRLEAVVNQLGGVGFESYWERTFDDDLNRLQVEHRTPCCIVGVCWWIGMANADEPEDVGAGERPAWLNELMDVVVNDEVVERWVLDTVGDFEPAARMPWAEYVKARDIARV